MDDTHYEYDMVVIGTGPAGQKAAIAAAKAGHRVAIIEKKAVVALLLKHPDLMQRPIVIRGKRAIIARPPEKLATLL